MTEIWLVEKCEHGRTEPGIHAQSTVPGGCPGGSRREITINYEAAQKILRLTTRPMKVLKQIPMFGRYYSLEQMTKDVVGAALGLSE